METSVSPKKKLSSEDIQNLISEGDNFKKVPSFTLFGKQWDVASTWVAVLSVIFWISMWYLFKIHTRNRHVPFTSFFFYFYIMISFINLFNSASDVSDVETERVNQSSQLSFIQGGIAVFILAFVFLYNINMTEHDRTKIYTVLIVSLLVSCLSITIINLKNDSTNIRFVRKMQQALYNQGLVLFMLGLYMIYVIKTKLDDAEIKGLLEKK
jgi:hypothetical protein